MANPGQQIIVIGAGIVGSCCAWHLQRRGYQVTVLDPIPPGESTSSGNAGCISPSNIIPFSYPGIMKKLPLWLTDKSGPLRIRWRHILQLYPWLYKYWRFGSAERLPGIIRDIDAIMQPAAADWDAILSAINAAHLKQSRGVLQIYNTRQQLEDDQWVLDIKSDYGIDWRELSSAEVAEYEPGLKLPAHAVVMYLPDWQHLINPRRVTRLIADDCFDNGALWVQAKAFEVTAGPTAVKVTTSAGRTLSADKLVIAAGVWSNSLASQLDHRVPLTPKRGYHCMLPEPGVQIRHPVMSVSDYFLMTPMEEGLRIAGTAEFDALDAPPDYRRADMLLDKASRYLPDLKKETLERWMGQRPMLPDSLPIVSRSPLHENVFYAFGHGHYGLTQGPTSGRLIADIISSEPASLELNPYRFNRF